MTFQYFFVSYFSLIVANLKIYDPSFMPFEMSWGGGEGGDYSIMQILSRAASSFHFLCSQLLLLQTLIYQTLLITGIILL